MPTLDATERILAAAEAVFAEKGPSASTDEVAARAGVAIGTVFKHFPTKQALLQAIMKDLLARLTQEMDTLATDDAPGEALFTFITRMVEQAAQKRTVVGLLAEAGIDLQVADSVQLLREGIDALLTRSQQAGTVREDIRLDEVIALLTRRLPGRSTRRLGPRPSTPHPCHRLRGPPPVRTRGGAARTYS